MAIYDNGDVKTKNNQLVRKIELNEVLNDDEKEKLLQMHEGRMHGIDGVLENEKRKQEQELDRALKERLDRRHRMREKQHGKDIRREEAEAEKNAAEEFEKNKELEKDRLEKDHNNQVEEILSNSDLVMQRQQLQALDELQETKKRQLNNDLEEQNSQNLEAKKAEIREKYMDGLDDESMQNELKKLMGDEQRNGDAILNQAELEKAAQEQKLKERLALRQQKQEKEIIDAADKVKEEIEKEDIIQTHEREVMATDAHLRLKHQAIQQDGHDGTLPTGCIGLDKEGIPITDKT